MSQALHDSTAAKAGDFSVRVVKMLLLEFEHRFGRKSLEYLLQREKVALPLSYLEAPENFVSFAFVDALQDLLVAESRDPDFIRKAAALTASPEAIGFAYYLLKAFGNPRLGFQKVVELNPTFNRVGSFKIDRSEPGHLVLRHTSTVKEHNRNFCTGRMAQFGALPTIWGVPPGQVTELQCQVQGADACVYDIRWELPVLAWRRYVGAAAGLAVGAYFTWRTGSAWNLLPWAVSGIFAGAWLDSTAEVERKDDALLSQNEGMMTSMADLQRRHEELNRSNLELENRVQQRTHDLKDANEKLELALQAQRDLDKQKSEFFDNVSHELRTPLTIILLSLESLLMRDSSQVSPAIREHLQAMDRSATKLIRLINNLLDLAKMEAGKRRLAYQPVEMHGFMKSLILPFKVVAQERRLSIELVGSPGSPVMVDPEMMDVVFQNLIGNALKFTTKGGVSVKVSEDSDAVHVFVSDTGPGMGPEDLRVIFNRFAQADSQGLRRFGGTGIGLALVKETVELHGGRISVSSELNVGSSFEVTLPKGEAHIREDLRERRQAEVPVRRDRRGGQPDVLRMLRSGDPQKADDSDSNAPSETEISGGSKRVLVVEDDPEIRRYLVGMLKESYAVVEARDGEEGLQQAKACKPDLILSDVMMPQMSGLQLVEALRQDPSLADTPVILLTARGELDSRVAGFTSGANDYIAKPFSPRELLARVESHLRVRDAALRATANERFAALGLVVSTFARDVRGPLNALLGSVTSICDLASRPPEPATLEALLRVANECGVRVRELADSLFSFTEGTDTLELIHAPSSIEATVGMISGRFTPQLQLVKDFQCGDVFHGSRSSLSLVWLALIDNAIRAMNGAGTLTLRTQRAGNELVVQVVDTGVGIAADIRDKIFEPFVSTRTADEGAGLGLFLARRIINAHHGRIAFDSTPGRGSTFSVYLPLLEGTALAAPSAQPAVPAAEAARPTQ